MSKRSKLLRGGILIVIAALLCSGCETFKGLTTGGPDVTPGMLLIPTVDEDGVSPPECQNTDTWTPQRFAKQDLDCKRARARLAEPVECKDHITWNSRNQDQIMSCAEAIKNLIDARYNSYRHNIYSLVTTGNTVADAAISGTSIAAELTAPGTTKVLSAIISGLSGWKAIANQDLLFKNSIALIVLQMDKDRASQATVIQQSLDLQKYKNMNEAANDLFAYFVAGTFDNAIIRMQSDIGAQEAACQAELKNQKLNQGSLTPATASAECPASSTATLMPSPVEINFGNAENTLSDNAIEILKTVADIFKSAGDAVGGIEVWGTATIPASQTKQALAAMRGKQAYDWLVKNSGIDPNKIKLLSGQIDNSNRAIVRFTKTAPAVVASSPPQSDQETVSEANHPPAPVPPTPVPPTPVPPAPVAATVGDLKTGVAFDLKDGRKIVIIGKDGEKFKYAVWMDSSHWDFDNPISESSDVLLARLKPIPKPS